MSDNSKIEWTDATWNPVRGCNKVSAGCAHCYAETFAERWRGVKGHPFEFGFDFRLAPFLAMDMFEKPKKVQIFEAALKKSILDGTVASETDLYHFCLTHATKPLHATPVLLELKSQGRIACDFRSPRRESLKEPRPFRVIS